MHDLVKMAISDFNKTLGIGDFDFPERGVVDFSFEAGDRFYIKSTDDGALFYLTREVVDHRIDALSPRALALCHYAQSRKFDTQCALKDGNQLIFIVSMTVPDLSGQEIENILQHLMRLHDILSP